MVANPHLNYSEGQYNSFNLKNPLHKYATYNALFTISGVTEKEMRDGTYLTNPVRNVVARSSGIGAERVDAANSINAQQGVFQEQAEALTRNVGGAGGGAGEARDRVSGLVENYSDTLPILRRNHDVFIENVNILSTVSPNTERNLANFTKMEFEIHEPYGITLIEKIRAATFNSGFLDYQDAPLLLTIEFRGFDENGKALTSGMTETRKIPILIAKVDFDVNEGGARYSVVAVPYGDVGFDDRFKQLRTRVDLTFNDFTDWKIAFELALKKQMEDEIEEKVRQYPDKYRLELDDKIRYSKELKKYAFTIQSTHADATVQEQTAQDQIGTDAEFGYGAAAKAEQTQTADSGTTIPKAFEDWMRNQPGFFDISQDFWRAYLTMAGYKLPENEEDRIIYINKLLTDKQKEQELKNLFLQYQYVPWFKIKSTVFTNWGSM